VRITRYLSCVPWSFNMPQNIGISDLVSTTLNIVVILFRQNVYGTICGVIWLVKDKNNNGRK